MDSTAKISLERPRFEDCRPLLIAGLRENYTPANTGDISKQWGLFAPHIGRIPSQVGGTAYGVCFPFAEGSFDYLSGVEVSDLSSVPEGLSTLSLPARRYAVFPHLEHVSKLSLTFDAIYGDWFPKSGYEAANEPCFERYGTNFDRNTGLGDIEVWVPIK